MPRPDTPFQPTPHERPRTFSVVFVDPREGFAAVDEFRAGGFAVDVSAAETVIVTLAATSDRLEEVESIVEAHGGELRPA